MPFRLPGAVSSTSTWLVTCSKGTLTRSGGAPRRVRQNYIVHPMQVTYGKTTNFNLPRSGWLSIAVAHFALSLTASRKTSAQLAFVKLEQPRYHPKITICAIQLR